jgi:hypothetical protein
MRQRAALVAGLFLFGLAACSAPTTPAPRATAGASARPAATPTPRPADAPLTAVVLRVDEAALPPALPTQEGLAIGRPTPTPAATVEAAFKYLTLTLAIENRSAMPYLVGVSGADSATTNLAGATLTTRDGTRYRPFRSYSSFGVRTATARSLKTYPVLLRLPPGFRVTAESYGQVTTSAPPNTNLTFKVPATLTDYGTLSWPPVTFASTSTEDELLRRYRPLIGGVQPLDLAGMTVGDRPVAFPGDGLANLQPVATEVVGAGGLAVTLASVNVAAPTDFLSRSRGWMQLGLTLQYRGGEPVASNDVVAWFYGTNGVVYTGDVPAIGDFARTQGVPEASVISMWDGRPAGADAAGEGQPTRRLVFFVPRELTGGVLVLAGKVDALYRVEGLTPPPARP